MGAVIEIGEVTVKVNAVAIIASGTCYGIVASIIGTVGIGAREDENVEVVQQIDNARIGAGAEFINEAEHEYHARHFVTMHGRGVEESRLAFRTSIVQANAQDSAVVAGGKCPQVNQGATSVAECVGGKPFHHGDIVTVRKITVPIVRTTLVPHPGFSLQRRWREQCGLITLFHKPVVLALVSVANDTVAFNLVNGTDLVDGLDLRRLLDVEAKIILAAFLHELVQVGLGKKVAAQKHDPQS